MLPLVLYAELQYFKSVSCPVVIIYKNPNCSDLGFCNFSDVLKAMSFDLKNLLHPKARIGLSSDDYIYKMMSNSLVHPNLIVQF